jgi:flagellar assembly protein FliH
MRIAFERDLDGLAEIGAEIAFEAVTRIIGRSYLDHEGITAVVREVIGHAKDRSRLVIRVSPADYHELIETRESLTENGNSRSIEILADDRVELGGCLLETPAGNLDGRLEVQLQQLRDTLLNARLRRSEPVLQQ